MEDYDNNHDHDYDSCGNDDVSENELTKVTVILKQSHGTHYMLDTRHYNTSRRLSVYPSGCDKALYLVSYPTSPL